MIPEYKCRRCGKVFDGVPVTEKASDGTPWAVEVMLDAALQGNSTIKVAPLRIVWHRPCNNIDSTKRVSAHNIGVGIADLIGGRDG